MPLEPDLEQQKILDHSAGALLAAGGPGSGKTWVLRERFARLIEEGVDPEGVALFTLTRRAGRDARDQVARRLGRSVSDLRIFSVHGYANSFVTERWFHELGYGVQPSVLSAPEQYAQVAEALADESDVDWPQLGHLRGVRTFGRQVADLMLRCQERLLDPDELDAAVKASGRTDYLEVAAFYRRYVNAQESSDEVDFGGLLQQTARELQAGVPEEERFEHVLVDDFQDATIAAGAIVKALAVAADSAVFAADPAGHVFTFQGGSLEPLRSLPVIFPSLTTVALAGSHRLGAGLAALAALTDPTAEAPSSSPGTDPHFEARLMAHPGEEIEAVADEILRLRVDEDVPWSEIAIVMRRYGSYLNGLRHALARHRIPFTVVAEETALPTEPAIRPLIDLLRFVYRPTLRADLLETVLTSPLVGLDPHELRRLRRESRAARMSLVDLAMDGGATRPEEPILAERVGSFRELVRDIPQIEKKLGPDGLMFELWTRRPDAAELVASEEPSARRALDAISAFADTIYRFSERRPDASIKDYLETLEAVDFAPDPWIPPEERRPDAVRVISAHRTQGLEFEAVLIPGCLEGEFPSMSRGDPLVSVERLVDPSSPSERLRARAAEERALFRMAVSRARRRTILFASESAGDRNPRTPSRFAARLGLRWLPSGDAGGDASAASLRSMETSLRRRLADAAETAPRRLAAAAALPSTGAQPERWWGRNDWTDPGVELHPDGTEYKTSYSRISPMENCGLQYLYAQELGLDNETSHAMWVGSLFHSIVDRVQRGEIPRNEVAVLEAFENEWDPARFESSVVEHQRHRDMEGMLLTWLGANWGTPLRSEIGFSFELPGATLRGKIDAIFPSEGGRVRVVDYKTSRYAVTKAEAQESLQLATYYLAVKRTPELAELGEPALMELAYPAKPLKKGGFVTRSADPDETAGYEKENTERLTELVARVRREDFAPNPDANCDHCRFATICPLYPEGAESPVAGARLGEEVGG